MRRCCTLFIQHPVVSHITRRSFLSSSAVGPPSLITFNSSSSLFRRRSFFLVSPVLSPPRPQSKSLPIPLPQQRRRRFVLGLTAIIWSSVCLIALNTSSANRKPVWLFPGLNLITMGNAQRKTIDGVSYKITPDMIRVNKHNQSWKEKIVTSVLWNYIGVPIFAVLAPLWYLLVSNFDWARQTSGRLAYFFMPWVDETFRDVKIELTKDVRGRVLDVGSGQGSWLKYCGNASFVTELEPVKEHLPPLRTSVQEFSQQHSQVQVEIINQYMENFRPQEPYDYIILGNVLCEVKDPPQFLHDVDRVLKPGGKVIFQEHIRQSPGTMVGWLQDLFNMYWKVSSGGCTCNRDPVKYLKSVGKWHVEAWDLNIKGSTMLFNRCAVGIALKGQP